MKHVWEAIGSRPGKIRDETLSVMASSSEEAVEILCKRGWACYGAWRKHKPHNFRECPECKGICDGRTKRAIEKIGRQYWHCDCKRKSDAAVRGYKHRMVKAVNRALVGII